MSSLRPEPIRIFVSSPNDVWAERAASLRAIELVNQRYPDAVRLEGVFWEDHFFPSTTDFQGWINQRIPPWQCELVVCILWSRIGSPLSDAWPGREDGSRYESGTVAEFEMTLPHAATSPLPDLYMFVKTAPLPGAASSADLRRSAEAKAVVEGFVQRWFHQAAAVPTPGTAADVHPFTAGFNPFPNVEVFEDIFVRFLEWWLREKGWIDRPRTWDLRRQGLPYVGLPAFDASHSAVFFGRDADRRIARRLLVDADAASLPYLVLSGDSGVGKSSLARAGITADLCIDTAQEIWVPITLLAGADPVGGLAHGLLEPGGALQPHLTASYFGNEADLAPALATPAVAVPLMTGALDALANARREAHGWQTAPVARLLLVLDQVEALAEAEPQAQRAFVAMLTALLATRRVWAVATIRQDRMSALLAAPALRPLVTRDLRGKGPEGAELKLAPPDEAAIRDIIEAPARSAGLSFEERADGRSLADELRGEVAGQPDALPLLQQLLRGLFKDGTVACWADYEQRGRLAGSVTTAADAAFNNAPAEARGELRPLLLALTGDLTEDGTAVSRPVSQSEFATPTRAALVAALLAERLLVLDGQEQLRVAHEALLRTWPRAQEVIKAEEEFIRLRERLRQHADEWRRTGTVLSRGRLLSEAEAALPELRAEGGTRDLADLVGASVRAERKARRRSRAIWSSVMIVLLLFAVSASYFGMLADERAEEAERNFRAAQSAVSTLVFDLAQGLRSRAGMSAELGKEILGYADRSLQALERAAPNELRVRRLRWAGLLQASNTLSTLGDGAGAARAAQDALVIAEQLSASNPINAARQQDLSDSYDRIGDVLRSAGDLTGAHRAYETALAVRQKLNAADPGNAVWQRSLSVSHTNTGGVLALQGDRSAARRAFEAALDVDQKLALTDPDNPSTQGSLSISHANIGVLLQAQGDLSGAKQAYEAALAIRQKLAATYPSNTAWQQSLADSYNRLGHVLVAQGDLSGARGAYEAALTIRQKLATMDPTNTEWQVALSENHDAIGGVRQAQGDLPGARHAYEAELTILQRLVATDPHNTAWRHNLCGSHSTLGGLLSAQGDWSGALRVYKTGLTICQELVTSDPGNTAWQRDLAQADTNIGNVLRIKLSDMAGARAAYEAALALCEKLAAVDPGNTDWQRDLAVARDNIGKVLEAQGDLPGALGVYDASRATWKQLVAKDPNNTHWQRDLSISYEDTGNVLRAQYDLAGARSAYEASLSIRQKLTAADPSNTHWLLDLSRNQDKIGGVLQAQGDLPGALIAYQAALDSHQGLATLDPGNAQWKLSLALSHDRIGALLRAQANLPAARQAYEAGNTIWQQLVAKDPTSTVWQGALSISYDRVGDLRRAQGDLAGARRAFEAGRTIWQQLAAKDPTNTDRQRDLSLSHDRVGEVLKAQGDLPAARQAFEAGSIMWQQLVGKDPSNTMWQRDLSLSHDRLGDVLKAQGDLPAARQAYEAANIIWQRLAATDPGNIVWQRDLSISHDRIGDVLKAQGDLPGAQRAYEASRIILQHLVAKDPSNTMWQRDLLINRERIGDALRAQGDLPESQRAYIATLATAQRLTAADPGSTEGQRDLLRSLFKYASVSATMHDCEAARHGGQELRQNAISLVQSPQSPTIRNDVAAIERLLAEIGTICPP